MTNRPSNPGLRRAARVLALVPALLVTTTAGAAFADPPDSWENPPSTSALYVIMVLVAIPLGLFVLITVLTYLPSMGKGDRRGEAWRGEAEWFGGPSGGLAALDKAEQPPALSDGGASGRSRGGDSGRW